MSDTRANPSWWNHQRHSLVRLRRQIERHVDDILSQRAARIVVDVGCGDMPYRQLFEARGLQYVACDITPTAPITIHPGQAIPLDDGSADIVTSMQVLEHVWDLQWYLSECHRLLAPEGTLLLSTHGTWLYHPHPTDFRRWTCDGLTVEIESRGFIVEHIVGIMGPLAWTTQFRLLGYREILRVIPGVRELLLPVLVVLMNIRMVLEDAITPASIRQSNACVYLVVARPIPGGGGLATSARPSSATTVEQGRS